MTDKTVTDFFAGIGLFAAYVALSLLLAFPVKWCWNHAVPYVFHGPEIGWGHAFCLQFLSAMLVKDIHRCKHDD